MREIRRRLRLVDQHSCHLKAHLPVENAHNVILTLADIGRYVIEQPRWLRLKAQEEPPEECLGGCHSVNECRKVPACRKIEPYMQQRLSEFFHAWDAGELVKAIVGGQWQITPRHPTLAPLVAAPGTKAHALGIHHTETGPRLTWR